MQSLLKKLERDFSHQLATDINKSAASTLPFPVPFGILKGCSSKQIPYPSKLPVSAAYLSSTLTIN